MMVAVDMMCEPVAYSASLREATQTPTLAIFRARPPVASPAEAMKMDRNNRMRALLSEAIEADRTGPSLVARENFEALLALLPDYVPTTDPYVEQCGSIVLDWDLDPANQLSIMLKDRNQIAFAAYFSGEKVHGATRFSSHELPETLALVARRWARGLENQRLVAG